MVWNSCVEGYCSVILLCCRVTKYFGIMRETKGKTLYTITTNTISTITKPIPAHISYQSCYTTYH